MGKLPWAMGGCCAPTFGTAGPRLPEGRALTAPAPRDSLPHSVARHARLSDPDAQLRRQTPRRFPTESQKPRMLAGEFGPSRIPIRPRGRIGRTLAPPSPPPQPR